MCKFYQNGECEFREDGICTKNKSKEDGLSLHCAGIWTRDKISYFKYYADIFSTSMKNKWSVRNYIDLFSGPGKCIIREDQDEINGTCLEVLSLKDKFTKYFFVDKNPHCIDDLTIRVGTNNEVVLKKGDCNLVIEEIVRDIPEQALSLAIIDPDSLQFNFDNFKKLSERKIDLIITYPIGPVERAISSVNKRGLESQILDKFHPGWREIMEKNTWGNSKEMKIRNLITDYINKIENLGYFSSEYKIPFKNVKKTRLYYLFAFSKSKIGIEFWKKVNLGLIKKEKKQFSLPGFSDIMNV